MGNHQLVNSQMTTVTRQQQYRRWCVDHIYCDCSFLSHCFCPRLNCVRTPSRIALYTPPTGYSQQHVQNFAAWFMSELLKPKNFYTTDMTLIFGICSSVSALCASLCSYSSCQQLYLVKNFTFNTPVCSSEIGPPLTKSNVLNFVCAIIAEINTRFQYKPVSAQAYAVAADVNWE